MATRLEIRIHGSPDTVLAQPATPTENGASEPESPSGDIAEASHQAPAGTAKADSQLASDTPDTSPAIELPIDELYFRSSDLDQQPYPLTSVAPSYPPHALLNEIEGWVRLLLMIDETGQIRHLEVLEGSPPGEFEDAALAAFRFAPFSPGRRGGEAVKSRMIIKVEFKSQDLQSARRE
ncbi:energy transducer TonB [Accumulibacter sp.]|uniref:TonB family protein n=1 Tax=Accumulibacter regalis TaxID=522306 RepID=C7RP53_ACCRE|nr:energy transducer TonB [Accumulibacter sp.]